MFEIPVPSTNWVCPHCNQPVTPIKYKGEITRRQYCSCPEGNAEKAAAVTTCGSRPNELGWRLHDANLDIAYRRGRILDHFDATAQPEAFAVAQRYLDSLYQGRDTWCWIAGPAGTGKTHLAHTVALEMFLNGPRDEVIFCNWQEYLRDVQASWNGGKDSEQAKRVQRMLAGMSNRWFAVMDDLDRAFSQWTINELYTVINRRYEHRLPTLITSMLLPWDTTDGQPSVFEEIARQSSRKGKSKAVIQTIAAIRSRCREMVGMEVVMKPHDYREQIRSQRVGCPG